MKSQRVLEKPARERDVKIYPLIRMWPFVISVRYKKDALTIHMDASCPFFLLVFILG
jgi:hypothetical protein